MKLLLKDTHATLELGKFLGETLNPGVILLNGDLGTGKTTLVQGIAKGLDVKEQVVSPTFTIVNEYTKGRLPLYHLDLYRLDINEILTLNLETYWEGIEVLPGIIAIEWSQKMPYKPENYLAIGLTHNDDNLHLNESGSTLRFAEIIPFNYIVDDKIINFCNKYNFQ